MERIENQKHTKHTFIYSLSKFFERASYYGFRSLFVLYLLSESFTMTQSEALSIYGWFTGLIVVTQLIGAVIGDLLLGNKKALILGGFVQALGAFTLCIPSTTGLYLGLALILLGGGFYTPNMLSHYGKLYIHKTKLLDSAFNIFYIAVNIGAFMGPLIIGYLGESVGWNLGFIIAGIFMLISVSFPLFLKETDNTQKLEKYIQSNYKVVLVLLAILLGGIYWAIYELSYSGIHEIEMRFREYSSFNLPRSIWSTIQPALILPIGIAVSILWTFFYTNSIFKFSLGFLFAAISLGVLFFIPDVPTDSHIIIFLISGIFLSLSEVHTAPITLSIISKYSNPKYLAIMMSAAYYPFRIITFFLAFFKSGSTDNSSFTLVFSISLLFAISVALMVFFLTNKKQQKDLSILQ